MPIGPAAHGKPEFFRTGNEQGGVLFALQRMVGLEARKPFALEPRNEVDDVVQGGMRDKGEATRLVNEVYGLNGVCAAVIDVVLGRGAEKTPEGIVHARGGTAFDEHAPEKRPVDGLSAFAQALGAHGIAVVCKPHGHGAGAVLALLACSGEELREPLVIGVDEVAEQVNRPVVGLRGDLTPGMTSTP